MTYPGPGSWQAPPVIQFQPLTLGQLFSGMLSAVRLRARPMFGISIAAGIVLALSGGLVSAVASSDSLYGANSADLAESLSQAAEAVTESGPDFVVSLASAAVMIFVTGMLTLLVVNAVVGRYLNVQQTWDELRPNVWRLIGASLLVWLILVGGTLILVLAAAAILAFSASSLDTSNMALSAFLVIVVALVAVAALLWAGVRLFFVTQAAVVEGAGPVDAIKRSWQLTKGAFWRILGRQILLALLLGAIVGVVVGGASVVLGLGAVVADWPLGVVAFVLTALSVIASALLLPYSAAFDALMYVDERLRKENLGPALQESWEVNRVEQAGAE